MNSASRNTLFIVSNSHGAYLTNAIQACLNSGVPLDTILDSFLDRGAIYCDSDEAYLGWGESLSKTGSVDAPALNLGIYTPQFYPSPEPASWKTFQSWGRFQRNSLLAALHTRATALPPPKIPWSSPSFEEFRLKFDFIKQRIAEGILTKAVPLTFETSRFSVDATLRAHMLFRSLQSVQSEAIYGEWNSDGGMIGKSPEWLFRQSSPLHLDTMALAGTRKKNPAEPDSAQKLLSDPKERHEHRIVVDDLSEKLSRFGQVSIDSTQALELRTLCHLKTKISLTLRHAVDFDSLVKVLHPSSALGLAPSKLGFSEMHLWDDPQLRSRFGAPFGVRFGKQSECLVAIRNVIWQGDQLQLGAGCGLVAQSEIDREWHELQAKREAVKGNLGL